MEKTFIVHIKLTCSWSVLWCFFKIEIDSESN